MVAAAVLFGTTGTAQALGPSGMNPLSVGAVRQFSGGLILALGLLVLAAELINTAIEEVVDHILPQPHPAAKKAKDCGSACVALAALAGGVAWAVILIG